MYDHLNQFPLARSFKRNIIFHCGDTNSGKTYEAIEELKKSSNGVYLAPLRLMALENADILNNSGFPCNMITGEERVFKDKAMFTSSTIEMMDTNIIYDVAIIDEIQMILDKKRGGFWAKALFGLAAKRIYLTGSENAIPMVNNIMNYLNENVEIKYFKRKTSLTKLNTSVNIKNLEHGDAIIAFSKIDVIELKERIEINKNIKVSIIYGGLSPELRRVEAEKFRNGTNSVLVSTDAIGMGLNLPIKRILFSRLEKFDGTQKRKLFSHEVKQIIGRAGRYGLFPEGKYGVLSDHAESLDSFYLLNFCLKKNHYVFGSKIPIVIDKNLVMSFCKGKNIKSVYNAIKDIALYYKNIQIFSLQNVEENLHLIKYFIKHKINYAFQMNYMFLPLDFNKTEMIELLMVWMMSHKKNVVVYFPDLDMPNDNFNQNNLELLEKYYEVCNLYQSLHYRFPSFYPEKENSEKFKKIINQKMIEYFKKRFQKKIKYFEHDWY